MRKLLKGIAFLYLFYLGLCLLVVLPVLNVYAPILVRDTLNRELRSELLLFNPFTLAADLRGVSLTEQDGHRPLAFDRVLVDLSLESLWTPGVVLDHFWVRELDVHVLRYEDGSFHFADLLPEGESVEEDDAGEMPGVTLHDIQIDAHTLAFTDRTRPGPFRTVQRDLSLRKKNLTTLPNERGAGALDVAIAEGHSEGRVSLENIDLTPAWRYEAQKLAFTANSARLDTSFDYSARWLGDTQFELSDGRLRLRAVDISATDPETFPNTGASLDELSVDGISVDLAATRARIDAVAVRGLALSGFDEGDRISLRDIFLPAGTASGPDEPDEVPPPAETPDSSEWQLALGEFTLDGSHVEWRTPYLAPPVLRVDPLRLRAADIEWPSTGPSPLEASLAVNDTTQLRIDGALDIGSGAGSARAALANWQLNWLHPLLHEQLLDPTFHYGALEDMPAWKQAYIDQKIEAWKQS